MVVFYGSQTGTAEEFANRLAKDARRHGMPALAFDPEECTDWVSRAVANLHAPIFTSKYSDICTVCVCVRVRVKPYHPLACPRVDNSNTVVLVWPCEVASFVQVHWTCVCVLSIGCAIYPSSVLAVCYIRHVVHTASCSGVWCV